MIRIKLDSKVRHAAVCLFSKGVEVLTIAIGIVSYLQLLEWYTIAYSQGVCMSKIPHIQLTNHFTLYTNELSLLPHLYATGL